jgi:hypothetical protein
MTFKFKKRSTVKGIAREMLRCFEDPARWTARTYARNRHAICVDPASPEAVCWCAEGAVLNIAPDITHRERFFDAFDATCGRGVAEVNDGEVGYARLCKALERLAS